MTSHPLPPPPYYDLPAYDDAVIGNRLQQVESRLQKYIADVLKHNDVAVSEKAKQMVNNILLIYEKRFDDLGGEVRQKMDAFKDWASRLGTGEQTLIEMDKKLSKIHDKVEELDAFHSVIKRHEEREKKIHSDLLRRIKALEEREEKNHDVLIDEGVMRHIEKMVEARMHGRGADAAVDIDIDALFDDSKLTPEEIEEIEKTTKKSYLESLNIDGFRYGGAFYDKPFMDYMKKNKEFAWFKLGRIFITNIGVYIVKQFSNSKVLYGTDGKICKMYTFKTSLNYSLIKYLKDIFNERADDADVICFLDAVRTITLQGNHATFRIIDALEKFEQIIRLIPGSFQNGDWVALGGFFGMYFNKKTLEISEGPPPMPI
jgi:hypothetical protein